MKNRDRSDWDVLYIRGLEQQILEKGAEIERLKKIIEFDEKTRNAIKVSLGETGDMYFVFWSGGDSHPWG